MCTHNDGFLFLYVNLDIFLKNSSPGEFSCGIWQSEGVDIIDMNFQRTRGRFLSFQLMIYLLLRFKNFATMMVKWRHTLPEDVRWHVFLRREKSRTIEQSLVVSRGGKNLKKYYTGRGSSTYPFIYSLYYWNRRYPYRMPVNDTVFTYLH